ncbi:MAG: phenylalanine--tRNA ligase subunit beta [Cocleimonas sp.]
MKVSEKWLREWVELEATAITTAEIEHQLIMSGTELDGADPIASAFTNVLVGQIKSIEAHPDADRLRVCQVDVAADEFIQIVTNATVEVDQKVPVAMIGAQLPETDGNVFKIKKSKLRGVLSQGMFCGAETLGMSDEGEGLLAIPDDAKIGADLRDAIDLDDVVLDLDSTPNRADLLSVAGVARELGVIMQAVVSEIMVEPAKVSIKDTFAVKITCDDLCQRYAGRIIREVNTQAETPKWMVDKLARSDVRSLGPVVDVTNYVMLELGQPMHGFDFDKLSGGINVRNAVEGEKLTLLDGKEATLRADTMVIADADKALALAGIMGGEESSVSDSTTSIYLESAFFVPHKIMGKARTYGLHTDSSHRFERGVSPDLQVKAIERATQLIIEICGGSAGAVTDVIANDDLLTPAVINFERPRIKRHLGVEIEDARVEDILTRLGFTVVANADGWEVTAPIFRFDIATQEDLIEEVARIYGYDNIPARLRPMTPMVANKSETDVTEDSLRSLLISRGYNEAITYSFVPPALETLLSPDQEHIKLSNPISEELSIMRSSLWSGLIPALDKNVKRQQPRVRFFETGLSFLKVDGELVQRKKLAGAITGNLYAEHWNNDNREVDFYDVKGDVEALLAEATGQEFEFVTSDVLSDNQALHPGQSATIISGSDVVGVFGALHPALEKKLSLDQQVFVFELDLALMINKTLPAYSKLSPYPSIRRDLALLLDKDVSYAEISKCLKKLNIEALKSNFVFDVYEGEHVEVDQKSLALGLIFQDFSRTLEEEEIGGHVEKIITTLKEETGATLR